MRLGRAIRLLSVTAGLLSFSIPAHASWDFVPTELEWQMWPIYCRVQYTTVSGGINLGNARTYSASDVAEWRATLGNQTFDGLHHYCASIHFLARSRAAATDRVMSQVVLNRAWDDAQFSYARCDPHSPVFPNMTVTVAQIRLEMGHPDEAIDILKRAIAAQPARMEPYGMLALLYRKAHKLALARDVLSDADSASGGVSAEIQYNLGLVNLELGDVDAAVANAQMAYKLDYPLEGLKDKLRQRGRWPN
jgi:tetratricopeptide (TPR) repeat protein